VDPDYNTLTVTSVTGLNMGQPRPMESRILYSSPNYVGTDSFSYTIDDAQGGIDTASVSITITQVNDPPTLSMTVHRLSKIQVVTRLPSCSMILI